MCPGRKERAANKGASSGTNKKGNRKTGEVELFSLMDFISERIYQYQKSRFYSQSHRNPSLTDAKSHVFRV